MKSFDCPSETKNSDSDPSRKAIPALALSFDKFLSSAVAAAPILPVMHTTSADLFLKEILASKELKATLCKKYNEDLLYTYYGRPAYKPFGKVLHTSLPSVRPICFVIRSDVVRDIKRVVPLDSGALIDGAFNAHITPAMTKECFEIGDTVDKAAEFVGGFFGSNKRYYFGQLRDGLIIASTDLLAQAYQSIVSSSGASSIDDRKASIEIQLTGKISLNSASVLAVALPESFLDDPEIDDFLRNYCKADIVPYDIYSDRPSGDVREVLARVKDYLADKGYL